ncbi:MAG: hypothetical protein HY652_04220 [Acidobacteria bacterium]|nr:hypothetical protein [Acidobacteriota bacterium]
MLLGLARPTAGHARVLGFDIARQRIEILRRVAFVGENKALYDGLTPAEMVRITRAFYPGWSDAAAEKCAQQLDIPNAVTEATPTRRERIWPPACSTRCFIPAAPRA